MNLNFVQSGKKNHHKCWKGEPPVQDVLSYSTAQGCGMEAWIEIWMNWDELGFEWISSWLTIQNWSTLVIPARRELFDQEESIVWKKLHIFVSFVFASWSPHYVKPFIAFFFQDNIQCVHKCPQLRTWSSWGPNCWNGPHLVLISHKSPHFTFKRQVANSCRVGVID